MAKSKFAVSWNNLKFEFSAHGNLSGASWKWSRVIRRQSHVKTHETYPRDPFQSLGLTLGVLFVETEPLGRLRTRPSRRHLVNQSDEWIIMSDRKKEDLLSVCKFSRYFIDSRPLWSCPRLILFKNNVGRRRKTILSKWDVSSERN